MNPAARRADVRSLAGEVTDLRRRLRALDAALRAAERASVDLADRLMTAGAL